MNHRIFIVEDDRVIAAAVKRHIESWGCEARVVQDLRNVVKEFVAFDPHLVLMDISLPFFNGYHWCREIRNISKVPVIFISSASDNMNIVMAMDMGGDDFIAKPFDLSVLTAKVQAVLRRAYEFSGMRQLLEYRGAVLDLGDASLTYEGKRLELTKNDFRILQTLMEQPGKVISREELMSRVWQYDYYGDLRAVDVAIRRLREKLEPNPSEPEYVMTKRGAGYYFAD